ncbi:glycerate kinase [Herbiconiux solani]|uniref:glycerate kinase n=1 Tax=Herbiconiux solani TaxID=661329 RepID=UPI0008258762|nr:glycerate kinase [Herbiconiux solani]
MKRTVVVAPDSYKGTARAVEVAESIAAGWRSVRPDDDVRCVPMADGGEGTLEAFERAHPGAQRMPVAVSGPDDRRVDAYWLLLPDIGTGGTGVVELAGTSGITLLHRLLPLEAHTVGFGQAVRAALAAGVDRLVLAIGGSASTDGGAGFLTALGARLLDHDGRPVQPGNAGLAEIAQVDLGPLLPLPPRGAVVLSDVTNPLVGRRGAVAVFGPQKGIETGLERRAESALAHFAELLGEATGADPNAAGAGAAGGTGFALSAWGATTASGAAAVADELGLAAHLGVADVVITGEGSYDAQSEAGKVPSLVRDLAHSARAVRPGALVPVSVALVAGRFGAAPRGFDHALELAALAGGVDAATSDPLRWLHEAGRRLASSPL